MLHCRLIQSLDSSIGVDQNDRHLQFNLCAGGFSDGFSCWAGLGCVLGVWVGIVVCLLCCCLLFFKDTKIYTKCKILFPGGLPRHTLTHSLFTSQFIVFLLETSILGMLLTLAPFISHAEP